MASYTAKTDDRGAARRFAREAATMSQEVQRAALDLGEDAVIVFAAHAPHRSGRLARGIRALPVGGGVLVRADATNPLSGYDYVGVTRFGHRVARIYPRRDRQAASVVSTGKGRGRPGALGPIPGIGFRRSVRGYHPAGDWAAQAIPAIEARAGRVMSRLGERITARLA